MTKLLFMDDPSTVPEALAVLKDAFEVDCIPYTRENLLQHIGDYEAFFGSFTAKFDKEVFARAKKLRVIAFPCTGTNHIDKDEMERRGVKLLCIRDDYGLLDTFTATAELAWMLLLSCHRHLRTALRHALHGVGEDARAVGTQLFERTLGVLGVGRLGRMTVGFAKGFRMRILGCDHEPSDIEGVEWVDFDTLLRESDAISIHVHMDKENYDLIGAQEFAKMKDGVIIVNTSRADVINEDALMEALASGKLGAFGTDVLHDEWRADPENNRLAQYAQDHENVVITPHIGGATHRSIADARIFCARKLVHYMRTGEELRVVRE